MSTNGVATEATNVKPGDYVDFSGDKNISVSHDGTKVQVELNKNIDVNYVQTNALNSKYNLSVGTMAENGIMPFLVNSTGAFYAANNNFSVDKDGKVIATAGEIGNVVLQNGVYTGNSVLRDGELYLGDASGNYSQITTTGAKLGQVTIAADGKISGVAAGEVSSTSTDAINGSQLHAVATEAGKHTTLSNGKNTTVESTVKDGQTDYKVNVAGDLTDITSVANGDSKINLNKDSIIISNGNKYFAITNSGIGMSYIGADYSAKSIMLGENGTTISGGLNVAGSKITGVAAGVADTDAVNVGQLNAAVQAGNTDTHIKAGEYGVGTDNKVNMQLVDKNGKDAGTVTITDVAKASDVGDVNNIASDIKNKEGKTTVVDAVNNLNNKLDNKVGDLNYVEGGKGNYVTNGENTTTSIGKLDQALKDVADTANQGWNLSTNGGEASKVAPGKTVDFSGDKNITISNDGTNVKVKLNEAIDVNTVTANTVTTGNTVMNSDGVKVGADVSLNQNGLNVGKDVSVTATAVTAGKTSISDEGVKVGDKTYISADGLNANVQHITNVKAGEADTDAVNYGQLKDTNNRIDGVENQVVNNTNRINKLGSRVNKVGAGAAALAALHPMDFDPDDKWSFAAGYGNYAGENAAAVGAYYRPDEKVMFSVGGTVGNGENMVNAGISFALDRTNRVSDSRTAMAREVIDLRGQLAVMGAKMAKMEKALGMLDETKTKLFPDIPANHWAYEYIAKLAGNGYIEGYPDGNFGGDRLMTRYEFAAMLYRAIENGAALEEKIIKEFEPELGRIRVDRISGEDGDRDKIERVRVNDTKGERDHYGNKLAK
ncbi:S-layer homology domain-containing protein [Phascolarctobacterium succinatutens]|uniref:S-layer homology domain-containing protein n=1 Tax=Phascolarctobacterium succinatutens TaxID=626940 RepID=UPI00248F4C17|nr:S-layer homology domain-containing protein [Phascolarctobacterium succinatutens]